VVEQISGTSCVSRWAELAEGPSGARCGSEGQSFWQPSFDVAVDEVLAVLFLLERMYASPMSDRELRIHGEKLSRFDSRLF
jgi:hypothetical protein